jgi:hypothetical protein
MCGFDEAPVTMSQGTNPRYQLAQIEPGFVVVERATPSNRSRCYFCAEATPPLEEYREGDDEWHVKEAAQSFRFSVLDTVTAEVKHFHELLGLLYYACLGSDSPLYRIGEVALSVGISIYIAITYESPTGTPLEIPAEKLEWLNRAFNDRIRSPSKKILILPDLFGIQKQVSNGQVMLDFSLTTLDG